MPPSPSGLPYAMQRTPVRSGNEWNTLADGFDQRLEVLERAAGQHAMTEVEDVARPPRRLFEHLPRAVDHELERAEQHRRVQVALHPTFVADPPPARVEGDAPVQRDDIGAGACDQLEQPRGGGSEMDPGHPQGTSGLEDASCEWQHALLVVGGRQRTDPAVEDLQRLRARAYLRSEVLAIAVASLSSSSPNAAGSRYMNCFVSV